MESLHQPHDRFFKSVFTRTETVIEFLNLHLPQTVRDLFDMETIDYANDSYVDPSLAATQSDLLVKAYLKDGTPGFIYILFEHKSHPDHMAVFQLTRYMLNIWDMERKKNFGEPFPVIIPLIFYHGKTRWRTVSTFRDYFNHYPKALHPYVPDFTCLFWDATAFSDETIRGGVFLKASLLLLKHIMQKDLADKLPEILSLMKPVLQESSGLRFFETMLRYILNAAPDDRINYEQLTAAVDAAVSQEKGEQIMPTIADRLREEGLLKGMQQGMEKGMQQGIQQGMVKKAQESVIDTLEFKFSQIPFHTIHAIQEIDNLERLKQLHRLALQSESLADFNQNRSEMGNDLPRA
ncbi:MAG: hypothetical protein CSA22_04245 [Deltaproteobacteria bacterium]|nr:MAG: hypothetical protein CSA22_04245 [Deltaproteobacteria bacterium]